MQSAEIELPFPQPDLFMDGPFSLKNHLAVMIDFISEEQAFFSLQEIFSQHFPISQCFLIIRSELVPDGVMDLQIIYPTLKVYHRFKYTFFEAVTQLTKILDAQFVAAFNDTELSNKWKISEAINKITSKENWKVVLKQEAISFVALRLALERAPEWAMRELKNSFLEQEI